MTEAAPPVATRPALPVLDDAARSADPSVCPFLRRELDGTLVAPAALPGAEQVCIAIGAPRPQSLRQQELVCLRAAHADCPRYRRGALAPGDAAGGRRAPALPRATLAALLVLVLSAGISFGFVVQRGGLAMPIVGAGATPSASASEEAVVASPSAEASGEALPTEEPSAAESPSDAVASPSESAEAPSESVEPTPEVTPSPEPTATPAPTPAPTASAAPTAKPTATPKSDRYKLLKPCPDKDGCWIYTVRSGDNLFSIAKYFGHSLSTIYKWNPQYPGTALKVGAKIRMPPPTK